MQLKPAMGAFILPYTLGLTSTRRLTFLLDMYGHTIQGLIVNNGGFYLPLLTSSLASPRSNPVFAQRRIVFMCSPMHYYEYEVAHQALKMPGIKSCTYLATCLLSPRRSHQ